MSGEVYIKVDAREPVQASRKRGNVGQMSVTPTHFGRHLAKLLAERGSVTDQLVEATNLPMSLLADLIAGKQIITADVAFALGGFFGMSPLYWLNLQNSYYMELRNREVKGRALAA